MSVLIVPEAWSPWDVIREFGKEMWEHKFFGTEARAQIEWAFEEIGFETEDEMRWSPVVSMLHLNMSWSFFAKDYDSTNELAWRGIYEGME